MPVTPYHVGPGVLLKAVAPRAVSLTAFIGANVAIDVESVVNLLTGRFPVHATLHTFGAALGVGLLVGGLVAWTGRRVRRRSPEWATGPAFLGGALGGLSHPLLDGIMHGDIRPFLPLTADNPLYRVVGLDVLHGACVVASVVGAGVLAWRRWGRAASETG